MNIDNILKEYIDKDYKKFHEKLCHTKYEILGIKIPTLRKISKELLTKYNYKDILDKLNYNFYEHVMLHGFIISNLKIDYKEKLALISNYLELIDNWAICDIFVSELKFIQKNQEEFLNFLLPLLNSNSEYHLRFTIVVLLNYYINDNYIDFVLNTILNIKSDAYYVKMAISWCYSICLIKYKNKTLKFLNNNKNKINKWTYNKALQKGIESFRINKDNKKILKNMKL